ncbi:MAG: hypothetical protein IJ056_09615 [Acidaminococcaceae bacterium]|nr:hypothetical protein [Acidaminococcaceae bacterium]
MKEGSAEWVQKQYDNFSSNFTSRIKRSQLAAKDITDRSKQGVDRSGKRIDEILTESSSLLGETVKSVVGYLNQAKTAKVDNIYTQEDYKRLQKALLPIGKTYCCVMKMPILSKEADIKQAGLEIKDYGVLFRLLPCVGYNTGILLNPDTGIAFISLKDIAEYLGESPRSDGGLGRSIGRLIKSGILFRYGNLYVVDDSYIRCGQMTTGVLQKRKDVFEKYKNMQGEKPTQEQGKNKETKKQKSVRKKEPQTQAESEGETPDNIPF